MERKRAQVRRAEVLGATVKQIGERGMSAVRIADIAASLDVSPALIIYHFETKERLLVETLEHVAERDLLRLRRILRDADTATARLMGALAWYSPTGAARGWRIWVDAWAASMRDASMARVLADLQRRWTDAIAAVIDDGVGEGVFRVDDPRAAATRITCFLDGLAVRIVVHKQRLSRDVVHDWLTANVAQELGIAPGDLAGS